MTLYSSLAGGLVSRLPRGFPCRPAPVQHLRPTNNQQHSPLHSFHSFWALHQCPYGQESGCKVFTPGNSRVKVSTADVHRRLIFPQGSCLRLMTPFTVTLHPRFSTSPFGISVNFVHRHTYNTHSAVQVETRLVPLLTDMKRNPQPKPETHGSMRKLQPKFQS